MRNITGIIALGLCISLCQAVMGETWYVDGSVSASGDGTSWEGALKRIQEGIDAATHGDTVVVALGVYVENIHFDGKNIVLRSTDPLDPDVVANTIIDGDKAGPVVTFSGTEAEACVLCGFTIRNGEAEDGGGICGGTSTEREERQTLARIENNVITGNWAGRWAGGLAFCGGTICNNTISGNSAAGGGGLAYCNGIIRKNTITGNSAVVAGGGLGFCQGTIEKNVIAGNTAGYWGGGLFGCSGAVVSNMISDNCAGSGGGLHDCQCTIRGNTIADNFAAQGGGLYECHQRIEGNVITGNSAAARHGGGLAQCNGTIRSNTISGNSANDGGGLGECAGTIQNNTVCGNSAEAEGGGVWYCAGAVRNCIIWGNRAENGTQLYHSGKPTYSCIEEWTEGGEGNISENPRFVDPDGPDDDAETYEDNDYRLAEGSPCMDAGSNEDWMRKRDDLDGNPRIADGDGDGLAVVDMGAYEYQPASITVRSNVQADYVVRKLAGGDPVQGRTQGTGDPKVFERVYEAMEPGTWQIIWESRSGAWPEKPVIEERYLPEHGAIVFEKDYIVRMPSEVYELAMEPISYATGTFTARVRMRNTTGAEHPPTRTFTAPIWLVVKDVVFTVSGPDSEGRLWNADGVTSEGYADSGDYYYVDVSDWAPLGPGETSAEVVLEFYIKDRNPNFVPKIEVWAYDPVVDQDGAEDPINPDADARAELEGHTEGAVPAAAESYFRVEGIVSAADGSVIFRWESAAGHLYVVEAAGTPAGPWTAISEEIVFGGRVVEWRDVLGPEVRCRFYRIRALSP